MSKACSGLRVVGVEGSGPNFGMDPSVPLSRYLDP